MMNLLSANKMMLAMFLSQAICQVASFSVDSMTSRHALCRSSPSSTPKTQLSMVALNSTIGGEMRQWEQEVEASTNAMLDMQRVSKALEPSLEDQKKFLMKLSETREQVAAAKESALTAGMVSPQWQVATAASGLTSAAIFIVTHNVLPSLLALGVVYYMAIQDPINQDGEEVGAFSAMARILGRSTIDTIDASKGRAKAVARAAIVGDEEVLKMKLRIQELETENEALEKYRNQRIIIDDHAQTYTAKELKEKCRQNKLPVSGTKLELLTRLVEAEVITA